MARKITDAKLDSRNARSKLKVRRDPYWRALEPGRFVGYRKLTGGRPGAWIARKLAAGRYTFQRLGLADDVTEADGGESLSFAQAQERAREFFAGEPAAEEKKSPLTVRQAVIDYIAFLQAERKTAYDAEKSLGKHVPASMLDCLVADLTTAQVEKFKRSMVHADDADRDAERRSKDTANRVLTYLKAGLNRAFQDPANGIESDAAWRRVKPFHNVSRARSAHLDAAQIARLLNVTTGAFRNLATAALLTGARPPHELAGCQVRDFRRETATLSVSGKTGPRDVVLTGEGVQFFGGLAAGRDPDALLLPKDDGSAWGKNHHQRLMVDAVAKAKLPADTTLYALRHTYASQSILAGINLKLLAENMGTSIRMLETNYGKFIAASRRELIEASSLKLGLAPSNVAPLARAG